MNQKERREEIERLWRAPESYKGWGLLGVYYQPKDPRRVVPKRNMPGWTLNFAHPWVIPSLILLMVCVPLPALLAMITAVWLGLSIAASIILVGVAEIATIIALCVLSTRQANRY